MDHVGGEIDAAVNIFKAEILKINSKQIRFIYTSLVYGCFMYFFVFVDVDNWQSRYSNFGVPAYEYPGADLRNIQMAYICRENREDYLAASECVTDAKEVKEIYPSAIVHSLNYPSIWVHLYSIIGGESEQDFMFVWRLNAILASLTVLALIYKFQIILLPLVIFSPVFLLLIERGNNDGFVFFFTFAPFILLRKSTLITSAFISFAGVLKIFPFFGLLGLVNLKKPNYEWNHILPVLLFSPLIFLTVSELPILDSRTQKHYLASFGVPSFIMIPWVSSHVSSKLILYVIFGLLVLLTALYIYMSKPFELQVKKIENESELRNWQLVMVSLLIVTLTSLVTSNWAYRFIFAIPSMLVLSKSREPVSAALSILAFTTLWIPLFDDGWLLFNYFSMIFSIIAAAYLVAVLAYRLSSKLLRPTNA